MKQDISLFAYFLKEANLTGLNYTDLKNIIVCNDTSDTEHLYYMDNYLLPFMMELVGSTNASELFSDSEEALKRLNKSLLNMSEVELNNILKAYFDSIPRYRIEEISNNIEADNFTPTKTGYRKVKCVRDGKVTICQKRLDGYRKKVLSIKQKQALRKARLKAHSFTSNYKREKSNRLHKSMIGEIAYFMTVLGWDNNNESSTRGISNHYFVEISSKEKAFKDILIRGHLTSLNISSQQNWQSPFEGEGVDDKVPIISGALQGGAIEQIFTDNPKLRGHTLISKDSTLQIWKGTPPLNISLEVNFKAFNDTLKEVEEPIKYLYLMSMPYLKDGILLGALKSIKDIENKVKVGDVPSAINVKIFNEKFNGLYRIESVQEQQDDTLMLDKNGRRLSQTISIELGSVKSITRSKDGKQFIK